MNDESEEPKKRQGERNLGASLQQKLRNSAKESGDEISFVLTRYINERFLYRLSVSSYQDQFILRGATLFTLWNAEPHRATRDIDLLGMGESSPAALRNILLSICQQQVEPDGVDFLPETLRIEERTEGRAYQGLHIEITAALGTARPRLEIDIAFGEAVTPRPVKANLPVLLSMPAPRLHVYPQETAIAEKCEALVSLGLANTRLKDFYDLWYMSRTYSYHGEILSRALSATFTRRKTPLPTGGLPTALTEEFIHDPNKQRQWKAFIGKTRLKKEAVPFPELIATIHAFLQPPLAALAEGKPFERFWSPSGFWSDTMTIKNDSEVE